MDVMLYYLGDKNNKIACTCSTQMQFFRNVLRAQLAESTDVEPTGIDSRLYFYLGKFFGNVQAEFYL